MKMRLVAVLMAACCVGVGAQPGYYNPPAPGTLIRLDDGTPLVITPVTDITSGDVAVGDTVTFQVIHSCRIDGVLLIAQGAMVQGRVEKSKHSKMLGRAGQLDVSFHTTQAVDGSVIRLRATLSNRGNRNEDEFVHMVKFLPLPFHSGILFNGRDAILKAGVPLTVFVDQDADFQINAGPRGFRPTRISTLRPLHPAPPPPKVKPPRGYSFPTQD